MAWVQAPAAVNASAASIAATFGSSTPAGNLIVVCVTQDSSSALFRSITNVRDNVDTGVDYSLAVGNVQNPSGNNRLDIYYKVAASAGTRTVTVSFTGGSPNSALAISEYDSAHTTLDATNSNSSDTGTSATPGAANPTGTCTYFVGVADFTGGTITPTATWDQRAEIESNGTCTIAIQDKVTSGSQNPAITVPSGPWVAAIVTFRQSNKSMDGTGTALALTGGEGGLFRSLISGDFFVGKFFQGGFFSASASNPSLTATGTQLTLSGGTATLKVSRILVGTGTQLTASGGTATLRKDFRLTATGTLLTLSGGTAGFNFTRGMSGTGTALALTGGTATLRADRILVGTGTQLTLSGGTASLRADRILAGTGGVLLLTGGDATMSAGGDKSLDATGSALALSGGTATLRADRVLSGEASILSLFGGDATLEVGAGTPAVTGPTPAGGVTSSKRKKRKVLIGDDLYEVDNLRDVEFLLKRIVRNPEPVKAVKPRKVVTERISTKADPAAPVAVPMASVGVDWNGLYAQLAEQDAAYARALVKAMEAVEEEDIETLILSL